MPFAGAAEWYALWRSAHTSGATWAVEMSPFQELTPAAATNAFNSNEWTRAVFVRLTLSLYFAFDSIVRVLLYTILLHHCNVTPYRNNRFVIPLIASSLQLVQIKSTTKARLEWLHALSATPCTTGSEPS